LRVSGNTADETVKLTWFRYGERPKKSSILVALSFVSGDDAVDGLVTLSTPADSHPMKLSANLSEFT
jgi:hypothetical protein